MSIESDFEVPRDKACEGVWIGVGNARVHIKDGDDGLSVAVYRKGEEHDSIAEAWATHAELEPDQPDGGPNP